jgi:hypothetical protein
MRKSTTPWAALALALIWLAFGTPAWAQNVRRLENQILEMHRDAMARYDELEFEKAKDLLREAVALATEHGLEDAPIMARVYADLAVVYASGLNDRAGAERALTRAVGIEPAIEIDRAYKSPVLDELLAEIKRRTPARSPGDGGAAALDCKAVAGIAHEPVASAEPGEAVRIVATVSPRLRASEVRLHYRGPGQDGAYSFLRMAPEGACGFAATLPRVAVRGPGLGYYIAAYDASGRALAEAGTADAPNRIAVRGAGGITEPGGAGAEAAPPRFFLGLSTGSAAAYLRGSTEQVDSDIQCCVAPEPLHARVELGYALTPQLSLSAAVRIGFPIGADLPGHAVAAPAVLVRLRHAAEPGGTGLQLSGVLGAGYARHTVGLETVMSGGDTDTAAAGPLLVGGGGGYVMKLRGPLRLAAELDLLVGVPVVAEFVGAQTAFGVHLGFDLALVAVF